MVWMVCKLQLLAWVLTSIATHGQEQAAWVGHQFPIPVLLEDNHLVLTRQSILLFLERRPVTMVSVPTWMHGVMAWLVHLYKRLLAAHCTKTPDISISSCCRCSLAFMVRSCWGFSVTMWTVLLCSFWRVAPEATKEVTQQMILNYSTQEGMGGQQYGADFVIHSRIIYIHDRVLCAILTGHWYEVHNEHFQTEGKSGGTRISSMRNWGRYLGRSGTLK